MQKICIFAILGILILCPGFKCFDENTEYSEDNPYIPGNRIKIDHITSTDCKYQNEVYESDARVSVARRDSKVYMAFIDERDVFHKAYFVSSSDFGKTWGKEVRVDHTPKAANCATPVMDFYQNTIYMAWIDNRKSLSVPYAPTDDPEQDRYDLYFNYSTDNGSTWQSQDIHVNNSPLGTSQLQRNAIVMEQAGSKVYLAWIDRRNGTDEIYFNFSLDAGKTWQAEDIKVGEFFLPKRKPQNRNAYDNFFLRAFGETIYLGIKTFSGVFYFKNSQDGGKTWATNPTMFGNTISVATHADSTHVYIVRYAQGSLIMERSDDSGDTFSTYDSGDAGGFLSGISLDTNKVYVPYIQDNSSDIFFRTFDLAENTWSNPIPIAQTPENETQIEFFASENYFHLAWVAYTAYPNPVYNGFYCRSMDKGNTWETAKSLFSGCKQLYKLLADHSGNAFVVGKAQDKFILTAQEIKQGEPLQTNNIPESHAAYQKAFFHSLDVASERIKSKKTDVYTDLLYSVWLDNRNNPEGKDLVYDVYFNYSWNNGLTWESSDIKIGENVQDSSGIARFSNKIKLTSSGDYVYALWLDDRENDGKLYCNSSSDQGKTWNPSPVMIHENIATRRDSIHLRSYGTKVFSAWHDYRNGPGNIYFNSSNDNAKTWQANDTRIDKAEQANNPNMYTFMDQVYLVWEQSTSASLDNDIYFSKLNQKKKREWEEPIRVDTGDAAYSHSSSKAQVIATQSHVYCAWEESREDGINVYFNASNDSGATWNNPIRINTPPDTSVCKANDIRIAASENHVFVLWKELRAGNPKRYNVYMNYSKDYGQTWEAQDIRINKNTEGEADCLSCYLACKDSVVVVVWSDYRNGSPDIYYNFSKDYGKTWNAQDTRLDTGDNPGENTSLSYLPLIGEEERFHFFWLETRDTDAASHIYYARTNQITWDPPTIDRVTPNQGSIEGNTKITIAGTNFTKDPQARALVLIDGIPANQVVVIDDREITCYTPAATSPGTKTLTVVAKGGSGILSDGFTYVNGSPVVSITQPKSGDTFFTPATILVSADATDSKLKGRTISRVEFYHGSTLIGTDTDEPYAYLWENAPVGNYDLTAKAYDNHESSTTSSAVNITVTNPVPTVTITAPTDGSNFVAPANINIEADALDQNLFGKSKGRSVTLVEFYNGTTLLGTDSTAPYSWAWNDVPEGNYAIQAKVYDNEGASSTSNTVNIAVNPEGNISVTPQEGFVSQGKPGGPFDPATKEYTITASHSSISWEVTCNADWVSINPSTGTAIPGTPSVVTISFNSNANELPDGAYNANLTFTNHTSSQSEIIRTVSLNVQNNWSQATGIWGGNISQIAVNTTTRAVFAVTDPSSIFRSLDNGSTWTRLWQNLNYLSIEDLVVHPGTGNLYAASFGNGIYLSADNGDSFNKVLDLQSTGKKQNFPKTAIRQKSKQRYYDDISIVVNPVNGYVFASVYGQGIYRSMDNGQTWSLVNAGLPTLKVEDMMCQVYNGILFAKIDKQSEKSLLKDTNRIHAVFTSLDNGNTWTELTSFPAEYTGYTENRSTGVLFLALYDKLIKSTDNGTTWTEPQNNGFPALEEKRGLGYHQGSGTLYLITAEKLYSSPDTGDNWVEVPLRLKTPELSSLEFLESVNTIFLGTEGNGVIRSSENRTDWNYSNNEMVAVTIEKIKVHIGAENTITLFASTYGSGLYQSDDNGKTWASVASLLQLSDPVFYVTSMDIHPSTQSIYLTGGKTHAKEDLYVSHDRGATWTKVFDQGFSWVMDFMIHPSGNYMILSGIPLGQNQGLYKSLDNGVTWTLSSSGIPDTYLEYLQFQGNDAILAASYSEIYRSSDHGASWTKVFSFIDGQEDEILSLHYHFSTGEIFFGVINGIFHSLDNGTTWTKTGLDLQYPSSFGTEPDSGHIYCGAWNGIHLSTDNAISWANNGFANYIWVESFAFVPDSTIVLAGTAGWGIYHNDSQKK
ncbi:MAG: IPT/TIG domain-containing protein [Candidatus Brocadiae bacterium]|nr:IPT/TIG domain-containing protein [Candidatus Brocadiia bacterium]